MPLSPRKDLERQQRRWADSAGVDYDARGFVRELDANLRVPLAASTRAAFLYGTELTPRKNQPARFSALHSSAVLVANVFDHWSGRDAAPLVAVLGLGAERARLAFEEQSRAAPEDGQRHVLLGLTLAYLGRRADALREGRRGMELMPISRDGYFGPYIQLQMVRIYLLLGEREEALDQLEPLLRVPFYISPSWLRIDPTFDPLRNDPRFRQLLEGAA